MRKTVIAVMAILVLSILSCLFTPGIMAKETGDKKAVQHAWNPGDYVDNWYYSRGISENCYNIVWYDFEQMNWQGWTHINNNAQADLFWQIDYSPYPSEDQAWVLGAQSDPGDPYLCSWASGGGYGNNWDQSVEIMLDMFTYADTALTISFHAILDTEPEYDYVAVEWNDGSGWDELGRFSGLVDVNSSFNVTGANENRFRFHFVSDGSFSPQDTYGMWSLGGYVVIDNIMIYSSSDTIDFEDCELAAIGDKQTDGDSNFLSWIAGVETPLPDYYGLANNLYSKDPCHDNYGTQVIFFMGSPFISDEYPGLFDTPYIDDYGANQDEMVVSPVIDLTRYSSNIDENQDTDINSGVLDIYKKMVLRFKVYRDLPLENQVFYYWRIRSIVDGCPGMWRDREMLYFNGSSLGPSVSGEFSEKDYHFAEIPIGDLVETDSIQVAVGVVDMCGLWFDRFGECTLHTPAPWFDDVCVQRYESPGPQWSYRSIDLFQDNFPSGESAIDSIVRADMAADINPSENLFIIPGDSIVVSCAAALGGGLFTDGGGVAEVYMHVRATWIGDPANPHPNLFGPSLQGDYGFYYTDDGMEWTIFLAEPARSGAGFIAKDRYCFDLNDNLFTRGYMVEYYFKAKDMNEIWTTLPEDAESLSDSPYRGGSNFFEFTCLPTLFSDVLYVDDFHGRGSWNGVVQDYFDPTFKAVLPEFNQPDRYDVNGPSSMAGNGPGSRAYVDHLVAAYENIIWDSGNLRYATVSDGTEGDKSEDIQLINDWLTLSEHKCGAWFLGDNLPFDVQSSGMLPGVTIHDSYLELTGEFSPGVYSTLAEDPFSFILYGGCPIANAFDVFDNTGYTGDGFFEMQYDHPSGSRYASFGRSYNDVPPFYDRSLLWSGFSFMSIRDGEGNSPIKRNRLLRNVLTLLQTDTNEDITGDDDIPVYSDFLRQNFPNPFNPVTTINYGVKNSAQVKLKIYNVSGQLVRTLVDEKMEAGIYKAVWDGRNNEGSIVATGIYFYRIQTGSFTVSKKMVLLR